MGRERPELEVWRHSGVDGARWHRLFRGNGEKAVRLYRRLKQAVRRGAVRLVTLQGETLRSHNTQVGDVSAWDRTVVCPNPNRWVSEVGRA